jgi:amidase
LFKELIILSAAELASRIRSKDVSPVEVVEAHLRRIEEHNPQLNAIVTLSPDVLEQARAAEVAAASGDALGPLHGVPITVKDTIETAGLRTTSGSAMRSEFIPAQDAPAVARLKAAGAIILGKTNAAEMAMDYTADNPVFGRTNNPHDYLRTPGGSSGGEGAAIAASLSPAGIGSDLAGSIRVPSHFCGIAGLKPTVGRVPSIGQFPPANGPYSLGAVIGPMARRVEDLHLLFKVLTGNKGSGSLRDHHDLVRGFRAVWYVDDGVSPVTNETAQAVEAAAQALSKAGLSVTQARPPAIERGHDLWLKLFSRASVVQLRNVYAGHEEKGGDFVRWRLATADDKPPPSLDEYIQSWLVRDGLRAQLLHWMENTPLIVAPVGATPAFLHDATKVHVGERSMSTFRAFSYAQAFNVFDLPVVVVSAGRSPENLPIGVQIVGRPFEEETVLAAAVIIEKELGGG